MSILHYYKNPKTLTNQGMYNSLQLWHSRVVRSFLTWPSKGLWPASHQCSLLGLLFLLYRYCCERVRAVWLIGDFSASSIGAICGKWRSGDKPYSPLLGQKITWYLLVWWQQPPIIRAMNRDPLPWKGKSKPSQQQWNTSPSRIMT